MGVPAQKPEGSPTPQSRPTKLRWHDACRVAGLIDTLNDRHDKSIQTVSPSLLNPAKAAPSPNGSQPRLTQAPFASQRLMAGWPRQGRLTASAAPIEQSSTLDPTTPPPVPKSAKGTAGKEVNECMQNLYSVN